ncbi:hypothetical protein [Spirosoma oryzicola]|uniref:hypothetical protein n=1 Tax=Spirosoma oryzicola TaxID=2898794 RepID=UPI001E2D3B2F|nr:hypothetical protein [Spirosoma oryzicola]UHG93381.1 hypothetical protein LQ777_10860 [Spirosoma oryzicola]
MLKRITLPVPVYLKKFLEGEYNAQTGVIKVEKSSQIGQLINLVSRPYPLAIPARPVPGTSVTFAYYCREKSYDIAPDKLVAMVRQLEEIFRTAMIFEVRKVHELVGGDYAPHIRQFLDRYDIKRDVDIDWETVRKIYRDYLNRNDRKNRKRQENLCVKSPAVD